ncbi:hypothetical protein HY224_00925 [Candidatus Uhrbacteria bacterium]|nr:hypothetical protein [Candidatus Uhrbacteria bacterium]
MAVNAIFRKEGAYAFQWNRPGVDSAFWFSNGWGRGDGHHLRDTYAKFPAHLVTAETDPEMTRCGRYTALTTEAFRLLRHGYRRFSNLYCLEAPGSRIHTWNYIFSADRQAGEVRLVATQFDFDLERPNEPILRPGQVGFGQGQMGTLEGHANTVVNLLMEANDYDGLGEVLAAAGEAISMEEIKELRADATSINRRQEFEDFLNAKFFLHHEAFRILKTSASP